MNYKRIDRKNNRIQKGNHRKGNPVNITTTKEKRGKPRLAGEELPIERQRAAVRALALVRKSEGWTIRNCQDELERAGRVIAKSHSEDCARYCPKFEADDNVISRCLSQGYIPYRQLVNAFYLWMSIDFAEVYRPIEDEERMQTSEIAVSAIKELLAHGSDLNFDKARAFAGTYSLYRPSHVNPNGEIGVSRLVIGLDAQSDGEGSEFNCTYESRYNEDGRPRATFATGKIIPHYNRALAILTTRAKGSFVLMFDDITADHSERQYDSMGGIMIAAAANASSAWPIYAVRTDAAAFEFKRYTADQLPDLGRGPWDRLRRGNIYWADETFPGFGLADIRKTK